VLKFYVPRVPRVPRVLRVLRLSSVLAIALSLVLVVPLGTGPTASASTRESLSPSGEYGPFAEVPEGTVPATAPDVISAQVKARATGNVVEVLSERTEESQTFANPDGSFTSEVSSGPVRIADSDSEGGWRDLDFTLTERADGTVGPISGYAPISLVGEATAKQVAEQGVVTLEGRGDAEVVLGWDGPLPAPTLDGAIATYEDVKPGLNLVVELTASGFEQFYVLTEEPEDAAFVLDLPFASDGLVATELADGSVRLTNAKNQSVATITTPFMWDARVNKFSGLPEELVEVDMSIDQGDGGLDDGYITLETTPEFFANPDLVYPVTIDPSVTLSTNGDTFVRSDFPTTNYQSYMPTELQVGTYNSGTTKARSFLNFSNSGWKGADITSAKLKLWNHSSYNCTPSTLAVYPSNTGSSTTNWNNQPTRLTTSVSGTVTGAKGYSSACTDGWLTVTVTDVFDYLAQRDVSKVAVTLRGSETSSTSWKRFHSNDATTNKPSLSITYNRHPGTATNPALSPVALHAGTSFSSSLTPTVTSKSTDPDGSNTKLAFEVHSTTVSPSAATLVSSCTTPTGPSGTDASCQLTTALEDGNEYFVRARGNDGSLNSKSWSAFTSFTVSTTPPPAAVISCPAPYSNVSWTDVRPALPVECTVTVPGAGGVAGAIQLTTSVDGGTVTTTQFALGDGVSATVDVPATSGPHNITASTMAPSGALATSNYGFGYGAAAMSSPQAGTKTTDTVRLAASAPPRGAADVEATLEWRVAGAAASDWNVSTEPVLLSAGLTGLETVEVDGQVWSSKTATVDASSGSSVELNSRIPVLLELQVCFTYTPGAKQCTADDANPLTILRVPHAFGSVFPTAEAGPGQVALWTGEFNISETDVTVPTPEGGLSISRAHSTYAGPLEETSAPNQAFGPGWVAGFDGSGAGAASYEVVNNTTLDGTFSLIDEEGMPLVYRQPGEGRSSAPAGVYEPVDEDTAFIEATFEVVGSGAGREIKFTELDGTVTTWSNLSSSSELLWVPVSVAEPGGLGTTTYKTDGDGRVTRILAPVPDGVNCRAALVAGCRALNVHYGTVDTAWPWVTGDIPGQVKSISFTAFDPDRQVSGVSSPGMSTVVVAEYRYHDNRRLAAVSDPRNDLGTTYEYETNGEDTTRLARLVNSGLAGFDFDYTDDDARLLQSVSRDGAVSGDSSAVLSSYVYGIDPATTASGLPDLTSSSVQRWQQASAPTYGAAEFGLDHPVSSTNPADISAVDWKYASLQFTDAEGYTINSAEYGAGDWQLSATDYDATGNVVRGLDNRAIAAIVDRLAEDPGVSFDTDPYASITRYNAAATNGTSEVSAGMFVTDAWSPAQNAVMADGSTQWVRTHTRYTYDEGAPNAGIDPLTGQRYGLVTTVATGAASAESGSSDPTELIPAYIEVISISHSGYDPIDSSAVDGETSGWRLGAATSSTTEMAGSGNDITRKSRYDARGGVVEHRDPLSVGADEAATLSANYTAGSNAVKAECGNKPEWAGMPCWSGAATEPLGLDLPDSTTTKYSMWLAGVESVERSGSGANEVLRTSTTSYKSDGRISSTRVEVAGGASEPELRSRTVYSADHGMPVRTEQLDGTGDVVAENATEHDLWGRETSYINSLGDDSTTTYVAPGLAGAGMVSTFSNDTGTISYTYDGIDALGNAEQRGLVTAMEVEGVGTYTAAYDDQASMILQTAPGGVEQHFAFDDVGQLIEQRYSGPSAGEEDDWELIWAREHNLQGQVVNDYAPNVLLGVESTDPTRSFDYDRAGRLLEARDFSSGACVVREYEFDKQGNRTSLTTTQADSSGGCGTGPSESKAWEYDLSSRVLTASDGVGIYGYDLFGRVTTMPAADAPFAADGDVTFGYYASDIPFSVSQGGAETSFTLDPNGRRLVQSTTIASTVSGTITRHYTDSSDNPSWVVETGGADPGVTKYMPGLGSGLGAFVYPDGTVELSLDDPHGDIVSTVVLPETGDVVGITGWSVFDEYGNPQTAVADTGAANYGWIGAQERATLDNGLILMGARMYNSVTGRFLSPDPVAGGNENAYNYPNDPVNRFDTTGLFDWGLALDIGLTVLTFIPVPGLQQVAMIAKIVITVVKVSSAVSKVAKATKAVSSVGKVVKAGASVAQKTYRTVKPKKISTGRSTPANLLEQVALRSAKSNKGTAIIPKLGDKRLGYGWQKHTHKFNTSRGKIEIHNIRQRLTGRTMDYKFISGLR
jgi:RHS repeat-associated protein